MKKKDVKDVKKEKKVKKEIKPKVSKPKKVEEPKVEEIKIEEPKKPIIEEKSYCGIKILSISKRKDGAYNVSLANGTKTILDERQYKIDVI